jgi:cytidylate kinase
VTWLLDKFPKGTVLKRSVGDFMREQRDLRLGPGASFDDLYRKFPQIDEEADVDSVQYLSAFATEPVKRLRILEGRLARQATEPVLPTVRMPEAIRNSFLHVLLTCDFEECCRRIQKRELEKNGRNLPLEDVRNDTAHRDANDDRRYERLYRLKPEQLRNPERFHLVFDTTNQWVEAYGETILKAIQSPPGFAAVPRIAAAAALARAVTAS